MTEENAALPEPELRGGDAPDFSAMKPQDPLQVPAPRPAAETVPGDSGK